MRDTAGTPPAKWTGADYDNRPLDNWKPPPLVYPCSETEKTALQQLITDFAPLKPYRQLEAEARADDTLVTGAARLPEGYYAFLENTAEKCTSPQTKHSQKGMQGAQHWVQRVDTAEGIFNRLTDGYGISLMFGERFHQFIRNSNNWRGIFGTMLDIDAFRDDKHPDRPDPVYSLDELLSRYPLLARICAFILPSASSLYNGSPFKARGIILFQEPITDQRVYREFGNLLLAELDCIPANVTKNPVAVGFGNTHNLTQARRNDAPDTQWIRDAIAKAQATVTEANAARETDRLRKEARQQAYKRNATVNGKTSTGENISAFIEKCDPVAEMVKDGLLTPEPHNRYKWHLSESAGSCEIIDGVIKIFSETMASASPTGDAEPINAHRFYLYHLTGYDITKDSDKTAIRHYLFSQGYGSDPAAFKAQQRARTKPKLLQIGGVPESKSTTPSSEKASTELRVSGICVTKGYEDTQPSTETPETETLDENEQARLTALPRLLDISTFHTATATEVFDMRLPQIQNAITPLLDADKDRRERVQLAIAEKHQAEKDCVIAFLTERKAPPPTLAHDYIMALNARHRTVQRKNRKSVYAELRGMKRKAKKVAFDCYRAAQETTRAALKTEMARVLGQTRIVAVSDATGTGKSHDTRVLLLKTERRTIALAPTTKLGQQLESDASTLGYNPRHLKGRDVNWDQSGLARIPPRMRDETMFDRTPCIMFDETEKYTKRNIAAMVYCQSKCPFRDACIQRGHLAQFVDLESVNFLITCAPNLLFNPQFLGFLKRLNTVEKQTTGNDELDSIDFDSTDRAHDTTPIFDTAIIDDYEIDKLYNTCTVSKERILALRDAWKTEKHTHAVSRFADNIAAAFLETDNANAFGKLRAAVDAIDSNERETVNTELARHARHGICEQIPTPKTDDAGNTIAEYCVRFDNDAIAYIPTADNTAHAENALKAQELPFVERKHIPHETRVGDPVIVPQTVYAALMSGTEVEKLSPVWQPHWTLLQQLQALIGSVATPENAPVRITDARLEFDVPPQDSGLLQTIVMLSPQDNTAALERAFHRQRATIASYTAKPTEWKKGVQVYQLQDHRVTTASVFKYPVTETGERMLQSAPLSIHPKHTSVLDKLNGFARATNGLTALISYKEFTTHFADAVKDFDIVKHFDDIAGLNLDGLKLLIIYGYPKVNHDILMNAALRQFANDPIPIPRGDPNVRDQNGRHISEYIQLTETAEFTENGLIITERRYTDPRLDAIRKQLSIEKLTQAVGRARHVRWENTITMIFTNAPIPNVTNRAVLFTAATFNLVSDSPHDLPEAEQRITDAEQAGDVQAIMETQQVSQRTAYRRKQPAQEKTKVERAERNAEIRRRATNGETQGALADEYGLTQQAVSKIIRENTTHCHVQLSTLIGDGKQLYNTESVDTPCLPAASPPHSDAPRDAPCDAANSESDAPRDAAKPPRDTRIIELYHDRHSNRRIDEIMKSEGYEQVSEGTVRRVVNTHKATQTPEPELQPITPRAYHTLTQQQARAELERLIAAYNYNAAALLRQVFRDKDWKL